MGLIPQKFEDIGFVFFGDEWKQPMANVLEVDLEQIEGWVGDPSTLPAKIEVLLELAGEERIGEIQTFLYLLKEAGISREKPSNG